jgi:hypothetical protein
MGGTAEEAAAPPAAGVLPPARLPASILAASSLSFPPVDPARGGDREHAATGRGRESGAGRPRHPRALAPTPAGGWRPPLGRGGRVQPATRAGNAGGAARASRGGFDYSVAHASLPTHRLPPRGLARCQRRGPGRCSRPALTPGPCSESINHPSSRRGQRQARRRPRRRSAQPQEDPARTRSGNAAGRRLGGASSGGVGGLPPPACDRSGPAQLGPVHRGPSRGTAA